MIVVTGATGQLGRLVIENLLQTTAATKIVAAVRTPSKAAGLATDAGVQVREADYSRPDTLVRAFAGASRVLLISSNEMGHRVTQHQAAIDAAKAAGVAFVAYTSLLHCDTSAMQLAREHLATERYLQASGLAYSLLRNGWYFENQTAAIPMAVQKGAFIGASGDGRIAAAFRADYAAAASAVLRDPGYDNTVLELAGDYAYTRLDLAAEVSRQSGKTVLYKDLSQDDYRHALSAFLPAGLAELVSDAEACAMHGALDDNSHTLSRLLGRPTGTLSEAVAAALKTPPAAH